MLCWPPQAALSTQAQPCGRYQGRERTRASTHVLLWAVPSYALHDFTAAPRTSPSSTPLLQTPSAPQLSAVQPLKLPTPSF